MSRAKVDKRLRVGILVSPGYADLAAVREKVAALRDVVVMPVGRGVGARAAAEAAASRGLDVRRLEAPKIGGRGRWRARNRAFVAAADAVIVFVERPREDVWHAMNLAGRAGFLEVYGPDGALWNPPLTPADPRPDGRPFYMGSICPTCGTALIPENLADDPDADPDDIWWDEWVCPKHREKGVFMDWPQWELRRMRCTVREIKLAERDRRYVSIEEMVAAGTVSIEEALEEDEPSDFETQEALAEAALGKKDWDGARRAYRAALEALLDDAEDDGESCREDCRRIRAALRRLEAKP